MNTIIKAAMAFVCTLALLLSSSCGALSVEESESEREFYEQKYADEAEPEGDVAALLDVLDTCVGGQYIIGGQGTQITREFIGKMKKQFPGYFSNSCLKYLCGIADKAAQSGHAFPEDYAWDCSGLWWYTANEAELYDEYIDRTANDTYYGYCTPIKKEDLRPGDLVFIMDAAGHVPHMGVVGRRGYIYEAVNDLGVVYKRTVDKRVYNNAIDGGLIVTFGWNAYGRPKIFE